MFAFNLPEYLERSLALRELLTSPHFLTGVTMDSNGDSNVISFGHKSSLLSLTREQEIALSRWSLDNVADTDAHNSRRFGVGATRDKWEEATSLELVRFWLSRGSSSRALDFAYPLLRHPHTIHSLFVFVSHHLLMAYPKPGTDAATKQQATVTAAVASAKAAGHTRKPTLAERLAAAAFDSSADDTKEGSTSSSLSSIPKKESTSVNAFAEYANTCMSFIDLVERYAREVHYQQSLWLEPYTLLLSTTLDTTELMSRYLPHELHPDRIFTSMVGGLFKRRQWERERRAQPEIETSSQLVARRRDRHIRHHGHEQYRYVLDLMGKIASQATTSDRQLCVRLSVAFHMIFHIPFTPETSGWWSHPTNDASIRASSLSPSLSASPVLPTPALCEYLLRVSELSGCAPDELLRRIQLLSEKDGMLEKQPELVGHLCMVLGSRLGLLLLPEAAEAAIASNSLSMEAKRSALLASPRSAAGLPGIAYTADAWDRTSSLLALIALAPHRVGYKVSPTTTDGSSTRALHHSDALASIVNRNHHALPETDSPLTRLLLLSSLDAVLPALSVAFTFGEYATLAPFKSSIANAVGVEPDSGLSESFLVWLVLSGEQVLPRNVGVPVAGDTVESKQKAVDGVLNALASPPRLLEQAILTLVKSGKLPLLITGLSLFFPKGHAIIHAANFVAAFAQRRYTDAQTAINACVVAMAKYVTKSPKSTSTSAPTSVAVSPSSAGEAKRSSIPNEEEAKKEAIRRAFFGGSPMHELSGAPVFFSPTSEAKISVFSTASIQSPNLVEVEAPGDLAALWSETWAGRVITSLVRAGLETPVHIAEATLAAAAAVASPSSPTSVSGNVTGDEPLSAEALAIAAANEARDERKDPFLSTSAFWSVRFTDFDRSWLRNLFTTVAVPELQSVLIDALGPSSASPPIIPLTTDGSTTGESQEVDEDGDILPPPLKDFAESQELYTQRLHELDALLASELILGSELALDRELLMRNARLDFDRRMAHPLHIGAFFYTACVRFLSNSETLRHNSSLDIDHPEKHATLMTPRQLAELQIRLLFYACRAWRQWAKVGDTTTTTSTTTTVTSATEKAGTGAYVAVVRRLESRMYWLMVLHAVDALRCDVTLRVDDDIMDNDDAAAGEEDGQPGGAALSSPRKEGEPERVAAMLFGSTTNGQQRVDIKSQDVHVLRIARYRAKHQSFYGPDNVDHGVERLTPIGDGLLLPWLESRNVLIQQPGGSSSDTKNTGPAIYERQYVLGAGEVDEAMLEPLVIKLFWLLRVREAADLIARAMSSVAAIGATASGRLRSLGDLLDFVRFMLWLASPSLEKGESAPGSAVNQFLDIPFVVDSDPWSSETPRNRRPWQPEVRVAADAHTVLIGRLCASRPYSLIMALTFPQAYRIVYGMDRANGDPSPLAQPPTVFSAQAFVNSKLEDIKSLRNELSGIRSIDRAQRLEAMSHAAALLPSHLVEPTPQRPLAVPPIALLVYGISQSLASAIRMVVDPVGIGAVTEAVTPVASSAPPNRRTGPAPRPVVVKQVRPPPSGLFGRLAAMSAAASAPPEVDPEQAVTPGHVPVTALTMATTLQLLAERTQPISMSLHASLGSAATLPLIKGLARMLTLPIASVLMMPASDLVLRLLRLHRIADIRQLSLSGQLGRQPGGRDPLASEVKYSPPIEPLVTALQQYVQQLADGERLLTISELTSYVTFFIQPEEQRSFGVALHQRAAQLIASRSESKNIASSPLSPLAAASSSLTSDQKPMIPVDAVEYELLLAAYLAYFLPAATIAMTRVVIDITSALELQVAAIIDREEQHAEAERVIRLTNEHTTTDQNSPQLGLHPDFGWQDQSRERDTILADMERIRRETDVSNDVRDRIVRQALRCRSIIPDLRFSSRIDSWIIRHERRLTAADDAANGVLPLAAIASSPTSIAATTATAAASSQVLTADELLDEEETRRERSSFVFDMWTAQQSVTGWALLRRYTDLALKVASLGKRFKTTKERNECNRIVRLLANECASIPIALSQSLPYRLEWDENGRKQMVDSIWQYANDADDDHSGDSEHKEGDHERKSASLSSSPSSDRYVTREGFLNWSIDWYLRDMNADELRKSWIGFFDNSAVPSASTGSYSPLGDLQDVVASLTADVDTRLGTRTRLQRHDLLPLLKDPPSLLLRSSPSTTGSAVASAPSPPLQFTADDNSLWTVHVN
jgi:hypothetical protein